MYRKIMDFLETWRENEHRKPLILQGARQVGKTYSILEFGRTHYENVAYFNFETNPRLNETFEENISPEYLIPILSHIAGQTIIREKTLVVFDEIQLCERALTSLKYFCEDAPDYHVIVAGSLLGVAVNRARFSFPVGKVDMKTHKSDYAIKLSAKNFGFMDGKKSSPFTPRFAFRNIHSNYSQKGCLPFPRPININDWPERNPSFLQCLFHLHRHQLDQFLQLGLVHGRHILLCECRLSIA